MLLKLKQLMLFHIYTTVRFALRLIGAYHVFSSFHYIYVSDTQEKKEEEFELTPQDGWYNNLIHPDWGGIGKWQI